MTITAPDRLSDVVHKADLWHAAADQAASECEHLLALDVLTDRQEEDLCALLRQARRAQVLAERYLREACRLIHATRATSRTVGGLGA